MMKKVYICSPLGGNVDHNIQRVKRYTEYALKCGTAPVVPHFYALCLDDSIPAEREMGMMAGISLLWYCDEMWIFGSEITEGMQREIQFCKDFGIKTQAINDNDIAKLIGDDMNEEDKDISVCHDDIDSYDVFLNGLCSR